METRPTDQSCRSDAFHQPHQVGSEQTGDGQITGEEMAVNDGVDSQVTRNFKPGMPKSSGSTEQSTSGDRNTQVAPRSLDNIRTAATSALWLGLLAFCGGMAVTAYLWLASNPPLPDCKQLSSLASDSERLYCAERAARSGKEESILAGFELVQKWSANHPLHQRVNQAMREWSKDLLEIAQEKADKGDLEGAIKLARKVPASSPAYKEVKTTIASWQEEQNREVALKKGFQTALAQRNWETAEDKLAALSRLSSDDTSRAEVKQLRLQLGKERSNHQKLQEIMGNVEAAPNDADTLAKAIAEAKTINPQSQAFAAAKAAISQWSQDLLNLVAIRVNQGDMTGAIAAAQALPLGIMPPAKLQDVVWVSRAKALATDRLPDEPLLDQLRYVWLTLLHTQQTAKTSPLYQQAQAVLPQLEKQFQDLTQLQAANSVASLGQIPSLQAAITMAKTITPDRPQRLYAQSLIARWNQDIQEIADRPNLLAAKQKAKASTIPALKTAIAQASVIKPGRALRPEAQTAIAQWQKQIQAIEDRPLLDKAKTLASQKKLKEAVQQANKIQPGRSLYGDAQTFAKKWTRLIQIAEDQPTLTRAKNLADKGDFSGAISTASKIDSDRALYAEAQASISRWSAQIEAASRRFRRFPSRFNRYDRGDSYAPPAYANAPPAYSQRRAAAGAPFPELPPP